MAIKLTHYSKIKDRYCICYFGHFTSYIAQLVLLKPYLEAEFPGVKIHFSFKDELMYLADTDCIIPKSEIKDKKFNFGHLREIRTKIKYSHPIEEFLKESDLRCPVVTKEQKSKTKLCILYPGTEHEDLLADYAQAQGYHLSKNPNEHLEEDVGWVISVENAEIYFWASKGVRTTLIPSEDEESHVLYKKMFPRGEIFDRSNFALYA